MRDEQLGITSVLFDELLRALNVPDVFADAVKERHYWVKPGNVFQVRKKSDNDAKSFRKYLYIASLTMSQLIRPHLPLLVGH